MTAGSSKHPPNWRLWHPSQGITFQPPLYPVLDSAAFTTEASVARDTGRDASGTTLRTVSKGAPEQSFMGQGHSRSSLAPEESTKTPSIEDVEERLGGLWLENATPRDAAAKVQDQDNSDSTAPAVQSIVSQELSSNCHAPFTPLEYKMPDDVFQAAKAAAEGSAKSYWSYAFYRGPNEEGKPLVHYCRSAEAAERALQYLVDEKHIGLDLEWVVDSHKNSSVRRNVSLVQLASQSRVVLLHLARYPPKDELATPTLRQILEDPQITKLGVWIKGDCTRLRKFLGIDSRSIFELSHLFKQVKYSASGQPKLINKKLVSLADQVRETMGLPLKKDIDVRASDWSQPLDMEQIGYSASDAYAAVQLFAMLNHKREKLDPTPDLPFHADLDKPIPLPPNANLSSGEADLGEEVADDAEAVEVEAEDDVDSNARFRSQLLQAALKEIRKNVGDTSGEDSEGPLDGSYTANEVAKRKAASSRGPPQPKDPRITAAEAWLMEYKEGRDGELKNVPNHCLRAYHMWHANADLDVEGVARLLRDPPLQASTVAGYILASVHSEQLPYDELRLKTGVMSCLPEEAVKKRYYTVWKSTIDVAMPPEEATGDAEQQQRGY